MNKNKKKFQLTPAHAAWGLTAFIVICFSIMFYLLLTKMPAIGNGISRLIDVLMPIIIGSVIAYLLLPVYNSFYSGIYKKLNVRNGMQKKTVVYISKTLSTALSLLLFVLVLAGLVLMAGPQIVQSIKDIVRSVPSNIDNITVWATEVFKDYPEIQIMTMQAMDSLENSLLGIVREFIMPSVNTVITGITNGLISIFGFMLDAAIGLIVCIYVLNGKETFSAQGKKFVYSLFETDHANRIIEDTREIHKIFSGYISGKLLDSLIIGMISFFALSFMKMPYAVMISVIVGVTNVIPFFGPFIGAIPSAVIIFTMSPLKSLYFCIYILVIQQIDGNIIGPKILGNSTGLPSFWVLFAITIGGGFFGFAGMLLGVPVFAVICMFISKAVEHSLERRHLPSETDDYIDVESVDPETHELSSMPREDMDGQGTGSDMTGSTGDEPADDAGDQT